jgi:hypothetical protein
MKKIVVAMVLVLMTVVLAYAYDDGDFQAWNTDVQEFKINDNSKMAFEEEFRWGGDAKEFYYHHYDLGFFYNLNKNLNIGGGYRQVYELKRRKFKPENEPYLTLSLLWVSKGFKFEDRNRIEYRNFGYQADSGRYRNKITVKTPWKFTSMAIQPYLSDEVFVGFGGTNQFNQNRLSSGASVDLTKNIKGELYYMLQTTKSSGKWIDANILGTKLKIAF